MPIPDGGFSPFWACDYSSLDATCYRLTQAVQLGVFAEPAIYDRAVAFIGHSQHKDGYWEESASVAENAPPWCKPGDLAATLYLTANCAGWLDDRFLYEKILAARFLQRHVDANGRMPSFLHTHWLAVSIWRGLLAEEVYKPTLAYLRTRLEEMETSNLAWMILTLRRALIKANHPLVTDAALRLEAAQQPDGRWRSEDGPERDVHTTLEALLALKWCGRFALTSGV